jgi:hypothetical protein
VLRQVSEEALRHVQSLGMAAVLREVCEDYGRNQTFNYLLPLTLVLVTINVDVTVLEPNTP